VIRFVDFAYIRNAFKMVIEIDGYQNHVQLDRQRFSEELNRQNVLVAAGYKVIRFSIDDVKDHPERCGHFVKLLLGKYIGEGMPSSLTPDEKELLRFAVRSNDKIIPAEIHEIYGWSYRKIKGRLDKLMKKGWIMPASGTMRVRSYKLKIRPALDLF
jgi:hypothetical protein